MVAASASTTLYDPLPDLPTGVDLAALVLPNLGLGLVVGRYWAVAVPFLVAGAWALAGDDGANAFSYRLPALALGVFATAAAVLVLTGMLLRTGRLRPPAWVGAVALLLGTVPLFWAGYRQVRPIDEAGGFDFDWGLRLGIPGDRELIVRTYGRPREAGATIAPLDEDFREIGGPPFIATPGSTHETLRYRKRSFLVSDGRVYGMVLTDEEAETNGVGVGDNLGVAEDRYPSIDCGIARAGEYRTFPYCGGKFTPALWIWFGQDPIRSIVITTSELGPD